MKINQIQYNQKLLCQPLTGLKATDTMKLPEIGYDKISFKGANIQGVEEFSEAAIKYGKKQVASFIKKIEEKIEESGYLIIEKVKNKKSEPIYKIEAQAYSTGHRSVKKINLLDSNAKSRRKLQSMDYRITDGERYTILNYLEDVFSADGDWMRDPI